MSNSCILRAITTNSNSKMSFSTFLSNGDGTFRSAHSDYNTTSSHANIFVMDANGDGLSDILQMPLTTNATNFIVYLSQGGGVFSPISSEYSLVGASYTYLLPMDLDGDGKQDMVGYRVSSGYMIFDSYISQGDGTFKQIINDPYSKDYTILKLFPMDVNSDGKQDLVQATYSTVGLLELVSHISNGDGTFYPIKNYYSVDDNIFYMSPLDINGDDNMDIIHMTYMGTSALLMGFTSYLSNGDGTFKQIYNVYEGSTSMYYSAQAQPQSVFSMSNGHSKTDILEDVSVYDFGTNTNSYHFLSYVSQGDGAFALVNTSYPYHSASGEFSVDVNIDGRSDIVQSASSSGWMQFYSYIAQSDGSFSDPINSVTTELSCGTSSGSCYMFAMEAC